MVGADDTPTSEPGAQAQEAAPFTAQQAPSCPGGTIYVIRAGDTLFRLAQRFNTTVDAILRANPGLDPNRLVIGQQICIP
ncbi:MAG: LysM peptidoglycan-binding domain-containing protein, partial [Limnochordales bacterium]|nr:LysM peptidoglycan-binding domain-containing protein [Limnochordales bacterium]